MELNLSKNYKKLVSPAERWDFSNPPMDIIELSNSLVNLMNKENGLGLAYSQTDLPGNYAIFAMRGSPENFIMINPKIVHLSGEKYVQEEGCLSFKGLLIPIECSREVRVRFSTPSGETHTKLFKNLTARVIQHEIRHLEGIPFWNGISRLKFDSAIRKAYKKGCDFKHLTFKGV